MHTEIVMYKRHAEMNAQERLEYLADGLEEYIPCPFSRDVLESWLKLQLDSGRHTGPEAGPSLDIAYEDWINPDDDDEDD
ncbi:hypothetical protein [Pseudomonas canadensis]|uniref:hypothetical protein n=1 Tax=Pseudomonas canadensis TaxID=915099 RepID=UPI002892CFAA|nr:hypothetical protein [Pseudomonas canadensis]WNJ87874.1 hypothetical protein RMQ99_27210 [Pseudomonas canadensis]